MKQSPGVPALELSWFSVLVLIWLQPWQEFPLWPANLFLPKNPFKFGYFLFLYSE